MLYWIWFGVFSFAAWCMAYIAPRQKLSEEQVFFFAISVILGVAGILIAWPMLLEPLAAWLSLNLPQKGESIQMITAFVLIAACALAWALIPALFFKKVLPKLSSA